jgi:hypothetical protein
VPQILHWEVQKPRWPDGWRVATIHAGTTYGKLAVRSFSATDGFNPEGTAVAIEPDDGHGRFQKNSEKVKLQLVLWTDETWLVK